MVSIYKDIKIRGASKLGGKIYKISKIRGASKESNKRRLKIGGASIR
jgi:hypothetical protein